MTERDWAQTGTVIEMRGGWNPKLHPRGWGGRFGIDTDAPTSDRSPGRGGVGYGSAVRAIKPSTKRYTAADHMTARGIQPASRTRRVAGHQDKVVAKAPTKTAVVARAPRTTKNLPSVASRAEVATRLPSRPERARLKVGAKVAGVKRQGRERVAGAKRGVEAAAERLKARRGNRPQKFKRGEYVTIAKDPNVRKTLGERLRRENDGTRTGQVVSKRADGKYVVRTDHKGRDVHEAVDPARLTLIKSGPGDPAPLRPSRELTLKQKVKRARRVWDAYQGGKA